MPDRSRSLRLDLVFYLVGTTFAVVNAIWSEFYGYRVWGNVATVGYALGVAWTVWLYMGGRGSRWVGVWVSSVVAIIVPTTLLVIIRDPGFVWGRWPWSFPSQPEVWVVERSARLLLDNGTPYPDLTMLGRPPHPDDYTPYGPVMSVLGLPRALFGDSPVTDARVWFILASVLMIVAALWVLGWPKVPVGAAQLAVASPLTALTATVAGDDLPVIALIILATALVYRAGPIPAGIACALVVNMKLTALPALGVLAIAVLAHRGWRALASYLGAAAATTAIVAVPVLLVDPGAFVEQVIKYPAGLGQAHSPAESPLPGHLIAQTGQVGHAIAIGLLGLAACVIVTWLVLRPPRSAADAMARIAISLGTAIMLAPATRWGYLVYPIALLGAVIGLSANTAPNDQTAEPTRTAATPVGPTESAATPDTY
jgi:hypothetical protein